MDRRPCHLEEGQRGPVIVESYDEIMRRTATKQCKFSLAAASTILDASVGRYCGTLVRTGEPFFEGGTSFVLPLKSNLTAIMSNATLQMRAEGSLPSLQVYLREEYSCKMSNNPVLSFEKLKVFFLLAYGICFVIFLEMILGPRSARRRTVARDIESSSGSDSTRNEETANSQNEKEYFPGLSEADT